MTTRAPVAPNGWPMAIEPPVTLKRSKSITPSGSLRPSSSSANFFEANAFMLERICAANASCISTRSMSASFSPARVERGRRGVGRPLEELVAGVERGEGVGADVAERRVAQRLRRLLAHQQDGRAAVGERAGVAGGEGAVAAVEDRLQLAPGPPASVSARTPLSFVTALS